MANVKKVRIEGWMPFTVGEDDAALRELGYLNAPAWGLDITYGPTVLVPNANGGQTAHYHFTIAGAEAVSWEAIERTIDVFQKAGAVVTLAKAADVEDGNYVQTLQTITEIRNDPKLETALREALRAQRGDRLQPSAQVEDAYHAGRRS
jgi:hypothetical protein